MAWPRTAVRGHLTVILGSRIEEAATASPELETKGRIPNTLRAQISQSPYFFPSAKDLYELVQLAWQSPALAWQPVFSCNCC